MAFTELNGFCSLREEERYHLKDKGDRTQKGKTSAYHAASTGDGLSEIPQLGYAAMLKPEPTDLIWNHARVLSEQQSNYIDSNIGARV